MAESDPDRLDEVDQEIRINELKERANEVAGGETASFEAEDAPPELAEQFWRNVVEIESGGWATSREQLLADGVALPSADEMSAAELKAKLDEILQCLARRRTFFLNTDHLSDRELYDRLLDDVLNEEYPETPGAFEDAVCIVDLVSSGSDEDTRAHLRYYADPEDREPWLKEFPDYVMPPYDRDRHLPSPPHGFA